MNEPKALMTQYAEGSLASRELQEMMASYAANARFSRDLCDDAEFYVVSDIDEDIQ